MTRKFEALKELQMTSVYDCREIDIPSPNNEQAPFDDPSRVLPCDEVEVDKFFQDEKNIATLVSYMSLEKSTFDDCFVLFSKLFRNTGDKYLPLLKPHIDSLLDQKLETQQMFLFALLAGDSVFNENFVLIVSTLSSLIFLVISRHHSWN